ncbi:hypothetical protein [Nocardioides mangrovi]|uniref:Response regulatory domain-containing protein n=1 Tax=Nocardioides mangrovi TaxID=2874580 RepID=A0ABS7UG68_9ACTN|nr:hypothetical protein [Nocardioides mangrovi]MBZ5740034.1 hypothetical protein [Nocardioides mangrovi]MBZ5740795.1 hypothetical protein [Nocardioides mangrovi]
MLVMDRDTAHTAVLRDGLAAVRMLNPVVEATTPGKAVRYLRGSGPYSDRLSYPLPVVVVTTFELDDPGGRFVLQAVRDIGGLGTIPVLAIGTTADDAEVLEAHRLGATAYLARSLASRVLVDVISDLNVPWCIVAQPTGT